MQAVPPWGNEIHAGITGHVVQAHTINGDVHFGGTRRYRLAPMPMPMPVPRTGASADLPLSRLLTADAGVVAFTGRETELTTLRRWRDEQARSALLLVHGPGGQGKTRLAAEFAAECRRAGWAVLTAVPDPGASSETGPGDGIAGMLVVVDYADRWRAEDLLALAADLLCDDTVPVRLLLVARSAEWWAELRHEFVRCDWRTGELRLGPLAVAASARRDLFDRARDRFAAVLGVPDVERVECPATVSGAEFGLVLAVHMAALVAVDSHARGVRPPEDPVAISAYLLDRERAYWRRVAGSGRPWVGQDTMARAVFVAVLTGALPYDDAVGVLDRARVSSSREPAADVLAGHKACYPPTDPGTALAPLCPDRLAEDFLALLVPGHGIDAYVADAWTVTALARLLTGAQSDVQSGAQSDIVRSGLTVLVEGARRWPHLVHEQLDPLLRAHPQLVLAAGGAVLAALADLTELDQGVLEAIEPFLPTGRHVDLDVGSAALAERLTGHRLTESGPATRALLLARLGERLSLAGRFDEAVAMAQEALRIRRALAEILPEIFLPELARSLLGLGERLGETRRWHEALPVVEEALDLYRSLPHPRQEELAGAFDLQGACLSELGRDSEALPAAKEAVRLRRGLGNPKELVEVLHNLAIKLGNLGRFDQALNIEREVLDIQRPLARTSPHQIRPSLALSLNSASNYLSGLGRHEEALAMAEEAVAIYRDLVDVHPDAFRADLARGLHTLGRALHMLGRVSDSLAASRESVEVYREFADAPAFLPALALVLDGFAQDLSELGHHDEAVAVATEAWTICRDLPESRPQLAHAATRLSRVLSQAGHHDRALSTAEEAVATCRLLHAADPTPYAAELAEALNALGNRLSAVGRKSAAAEVTAEAVSLFRTIRQDARLAGTLYNLANHLIATDRAAEALAAAEEAVAHFRTLGGREHVPKLARVLSELGAFLWKAGRLDEAQRATGEAIEIYRRLAVDEPAVYLPRLARSLRNSCTWLAATNRWQEALTAIEESVAITHMLTGTGSQDGVSEELLALARHQIGRQRRNR